MYFYQPMESGYTSIDQVNAENNKARSPSIQQVSQKADALLVALDHSVKLHDKLRLRASTLPQYHSLDSHKKAKTINEVEEYKFIAERILRLEIEVHRIRTEVETRTRRHSKSNTLQWKDILHATLLMTISCEIIILFIIYL
jgi:hypothetical protein